MIPWGARAKTWALIALGVVVLLASVSGYSYWKGYERRDVEAEAELAQALRAERELLLEAHNRQLAALKSKVRGEDEARRIREAPRPDYPLCDAGADWLHHIQGSVRGANLAAGVD